MTPAEELVAFAKAVIGMRNAQRDALIPGSKTTRGDVFIHERRVDDLAAHYVSGPIDAPEWPKGEEVLVRDEGQ